MTDSTSRPEPATVPPADREQQRDRSSLVGRRKVMQGAALAGVGIALAACGGDSDEPTPAASNTAPAPSETPQNSPSTESPDALTDTADVPVDGGIIIGEVVVTQPEKGSFKGFSAICTHQNCLVDEVANGIISCPCHGSEYSVEDGSVLGGPAPEPLPEVGVNVRDGQVFRA